MRRVYLLLLRTHYVFTDVRTTYLPMYVLLLLLIYRCTYYTLTDFTYYYYVPMYLPLLTEPGACPSALLWADLLINVRSLPILNTYSPSWARARGGARRTAGRGEGRCAPAPA